MQLIRPTGGVYNKELKRIGGKNEDRLALIASSPVPT